MSKRVVAYRPGHRFPAVSLTGTRCELQCDHCRGHFLRSMLDASPPGSLPQLARSLRDAGAEGLLVSGGCDRRGRLPVLGRLDEIRAVRELGLRVNLHTGLLDREGAAQLVGTGADCYSVDVVQDEDAIAEVLHLRVHADAYCDTLANLLAAGAGRVVPHICVGLRGDDVRGEHAAIDLVARFPVSALVLLWRIPAPGTPMRQVPNASAESFLEVVRNATGRLSCPVLLGCMRPRGSVDVEVEAVHCGVAGIASPSRETVLRLKAEGYEVEQAERCCALHE